MKRDIIKFLCNPWFYLFLIYSYAIPFIFGADKDTCFRLVYLYLCLIFSFGVVIPALDRFELWIRAKQNHYYKS